MKRADAMFALKASLAIASALQKALEDEGDLEDEVVLDDLVSDLNTLRRAMREVCS